mmetsp:Transcript_4207/g.5848  ORF Transcript_4207/g.5848 Transcript_4207/m.5848 type:complete len:124 (-) Transcript_4207:341-712(-)
MGQTSSPITFDIKSPFHQSKNPNLSAYAHVNGNFNFNATSLAPPGNKVVAHNKPSQRALNGDVGWYTGPSSHYYPCVKVIIPFTRAERDVDTVAFSPKTFRYFQVNLQEYLLQTMYLCCKLAI